MNARTIGWIGYDWFKLAVTIILLLLLLWLALSRAPAPAATAPAPAAAATAPAPAAAAATAPAPAAAATAPAPAAAAPAAPALTSPAAASQLQAGTTTFSGTAAPGSQVQISLDGKPLGTATADASGKWSIDAAIDSPGDHTVVAQALGANGAVAAASAPLRLSVAAPPAAAAPTIDQPAGAVAAGALALSGTGSPGTQITIFVDGQPAGTATVGADGSWSLPVTLPEGQHVLTARALDTAGKELAASQPLQLSVAAAAASGAAPAIGFPADGATLGAGSFTMSGTGAPGSTIEILDSDKVIGTATVGADGAWSFPVQPAGATAAYSARAAGTTDVTAKPIRVTFGAGQAANCTGLAASCDAWVTRKGGLSLRMRAGPGTDQAVIAKLPVGTQVTLLEGPQSAGGLGWWRVRTLGAREGWVAGEELVLQPD